MPEQLHWPLYGLSSELDIVSLRMVHQEKIAVEVFQTGWIAWGKIVLVGLVP